MNERIICVTGGYGQLGKEIVKAFKTNGDKVLITGRDKTKLHSMANELSCDAFVHDVTEENDVKRLRKYIESKYEKLDVLVNNAGLMRSQPVTTMDPKLFLEVLKTNLYGPFLCVHHLLPVLKSAGNALIINISSTSGHRADPGASAYNASKYGLMGFTEAIRNELRLMNVRVTTISPSSIVYSSPDLGDHGIGLSGVDVAQAAVFLANSSDTALFRDLEIWGTNPQGGQQTLDE